MTLLDTDTFTRSNTAGNTTISNAAGWGTASGGSAWSSDNGTYTFSILSNTGKVTGDVVTNTMYLGSTTSTDGDIKVRIKQDHAGDRAGVTLRRSASGTFYRAELINGTTLSLFKNAAGTTSQIGSNVTFNYTTSQLCWIRFKLRGSSLAAKAWLDGNSEPDWMITATDTSVTAAGNFGVNIKLNAAGDVVEFDSLTINDLSTTYTEQTRAKYITRASFHGLAANKYQTRSILETPIQDIFRVGLPLELITAAHENFLILYIPPPNPSLYSTTILAASPTLYYRMNEFGGSIAVDVTGNLNDGRLSGVLAYSQPGALIADGNSSIQFSANGAVSFPPGLFLTTPSALSLTYWIKMSSGWQFVAVAVDAVSELVYINGVPYSVGSGSDTVQIVKDMSLSGIGTTAYLDEIALFPYKLSALQIYTFYNANSFNRMAYTDTFVGVDGLLSLSTIDGTDSFTGIG